MKSISIREIARLAGVSPGAVSAVLNQKNDKIRVNEETRERILAVAHENHYTPNINAKRLFSKRAGVIGLVVPSHQHLGSHVFEDRHIAGIVSGIEEELSANHSNLLLIFQDDAFVEEERYHELFRSNAVDGLLIWGAKREQAFWRGLHAHNYSYIFLGNRPEDGCAHASWMHDYERGAYEVAGYMLNRGHRSVGWFCGCADITIENQVNQGVVRALSECGLPLNSWIPLAIDYNGERLEERILALRDMQPAPTGFLFPNYELAMRALTILNSHGVRVPEDCSVACCDSTGREAQGRTQITRVEVDDKLLGADAIQALYGLINNTGSAIERTLPVRFVCGTTCIPVVKA